MRSVIQTTTPSIRHSHMPRRVVFSVVLAALLMLAAARQSRAQTIRLHPAATVEPGKVRVGDVATITGVDQATADQFAQCLITTTSHSVTIRAEQVLFAIISENGNTPLTCRLQVNGPIECAVAIGDVSGRTKPTTGQPIPTASLTQAGPPTLAANQPVCATPAPTPLITAQPAAPSTPRPEAVAASASSNSTLAQMLAAQVIEQLAVPREDVRINFDTANALLDQLTPADAHWVFRPIGGNFIGTVEWDTQLVQGTHPTRHLTVLATVTVRSTVVIALDNIRKGDIVTARQIKVQDHWIDRRIPTLFSKAEDVVGQAALPAKGIGAGTMLDQRDFKPVSMAETGELVTVYLVSGGLTIKDQARAMGSGRLHETVLLRSDSAGGGKAGTEYQATLIDRDLAVVGGPVDATLEAKLKELR